MGVQDNSCMYVCMTFLESSKEFMTFLVSPLEFVRVQRSSYYESYVYRQVHESSCYEYSDQDNVDLME